jgi:hypothetical protein
MVILRLSKNEGDDTILVSVFIITSLVNSAGSQPYPQILDSG